MKDTVSSIGWAHLYLFLCQKEKEVRGRGKEVVGADFMSGNRHFMEHGQPHA